MSQLPKVSVRISTKLSLALAGATVAALVIYGWYRVANEQHELQTAVARELTTLATSLRVSFETSGDNDDLRNIQSTLYTFERADPAIDVRVFDVAGNIVARSDDRPTGMDDVLAMQAMLHSTAVSRFSGERDLDRATVAVPIVGKYGSVIGALTLGRDLEAERQDVVATADGMVAFGVVVVAVMALVGLFFGNLYVSRPLSKVIAAMREIRSGRLDQTVPEGQHDEIGVLTAEFNAMSHALNDARVALAKADDERRQLATGLQRADKLITVGQLSAGLAHEIGSPLQIVAGRARMLLELADNRDTVRRNATIVIEQSERIARVVEDLLRFSRRAPQRLSSLDVASATHTVVDLVDILARRSQVRIVTTVAAGVQSILADRDQVQQILMNLLTNALRASESGGEIHINLRPGTLTATDPSVQNILPVRPAVIIEVEDEGIGMDEAVREHIFEPFFTRWSEERGTGLGLSVVQALVRDHGGRISVTSKVGVGSCFTVELPIDGPRQKHERVA